MKKILIIDDEQNHRLMMRLHLEDAGYKCFESDDGETAYNMINDVSPDLLLLDITMEVTDGLTLLNRIRSEGITTPVVMVTAHTDAKTAVNAMKSGANDFITKPVNIEEMLNTIKDILSSNEQKRPKASNNYKFDGVFSSKAMTDIIGLLSMAAPTDATILILGESGTGKELIAKSIHENSKRANKPFVAVNCAALNDNLIESELFGHVKGAFTGATSTRQGRFEQASGGTIFLDELGEIPLSTQTKLLRTLQEKVIEPVGSNKSLKIDTRIIAATNKNLKTMVDNGTFRQDLYFRLNVFPVTVPPLRERISDIPLLIKHFIKKYAFSFGKNIQAADDDYIEILKNYSFPGNIRELENIVERSIILTSGDKLTSDTLPALDTNNNLTLKNTEKQSIIDALKHSEGNKTNAAKLLGISRRALYYKLEQYNLTDL